MSEILSSMPSPLSLYLKAAFTAWRKPQGKPAIPSLNAQLRQARVDKDNLAVYNALCGFKKSQFLPITYPQVMVSSLHMHLMTQPAFPLPLLGLVHLRNHIQQKRPLRVDEGFGVKVSTGEAREVKQGLEFDLLTEFAADEEVVWRAVTTVLFRVPGPKSQSKPAAVNPQLAGYRNFDAPADIGRRYARVSGDYNPIHLTAASAKLFGFKRAIAHGMWTLARVAGLLQDQLGDVEPKELSVQFKQPLFLPGKVAAKFQRGSESIEFAVLSRDSDKVHLTGTLR